MQLASVELAERILAVAGFDDVIAGPLREIATTWRREAESSTIMMVFAMEFLAKLRRR